MKTKFIDKSFPYDGTQLRSLFAYLDYKIQGDSIVSWVGPCSISFEHMVDGEDLLDQSPIRGDEMVHFIIEKFHTSLVAGVALQRLFASIVGDWIREHAQTSIRRDGDDLFIGDGKLSISIATLSPMSTLIHFAVNVTNKGTPVQTACLKDLAMDPQVFAEAVMQRFSAEIESIEAATVKVKWVE